jgi:hypothetical protein
MKKLLLLKLTFVLTLICTGCSNDDDNNSTTSIVGKWRTEKFDYYTDNQFDNTEITVEENSTCPDYIEFKTNGNYESIDKDVDCVTSVDESGTYTFNGTTLTNNSNGSITTGTVTYLTTTDLKIEFIETSLGGTIFKNVGYFKKIN